MKKRIDISTYPIENHTISEYREIWDSSNKTIFQTKVKDLNLEKFRFKYYLLRNNQSNRGKLSQRASFSINVIKFILELITYFPYSIFSLCFERELNTYTYHWLVSRSSERILSKNH